MDSTATEARLKRKRPVETKSFRGYSCLALPGEPCENIRVEIQGAGTAVTDPPSRTRLHEMADPARLELATHDLEGRRSILLS